MLMTTSYEQSEEEAVRLVYRHLCGTEDTEDIFYKIERGDGLDRKAFSELRQALQFLIERWRGRPVVPKLLAAAFVDLTSMTMLPLDRYPPDEQEAIEDAGIELVELAGQLFEAPPLSSRSVIVRSKGRLADDNSPA